VTGTARAALRAARHARGWSQTEAARELAALAGATGGPTAAPASLKSLLSRWENGHAIPEPQYRALLGELYGRTAVELDLEPTAAAPVGSHARLRARLAASAAVDTRLLHAWEDQLAIGRRLDDEVGTAGAAGLVRALADELEHALVHALDPPLRAAVGRLFTAAATLAGWQDLDLGDPEQAWRRFDRARDAAVVVVVAAHGCPFDASAAMTSSAPPAAAAAVAEALAAEATAGLAATLVELGDPDAALTLLAHAPAAATNEARAWLEAARGTALAARGRAVEARRRFALAEQASAADEAHIGTAAAVGGRAPTVEPAEVRRRRGQALAVLGEPDAAAELQAALAAGIRSVRDRAAAHAALAVALGAAPAAAEHARVARALAERIGSTQAIALLTRAGQC